jgi:hypothetical protein
MDVHTAVYGLTGQIGVTYPAFADENLRAGANVVTQVSWSSIGEPFFNYGTIGSRGSLNIEHRDFKPYQETRALASFSKRVENITLAELPPGRTLQPTLMKHA